MTIRTITLSPGFDHEVRVNHIDPGSVGQVLSWVTHAAGKGLNVARIASALGAPCVAYSLVGEENADRFEAAALADGVEAITFSVPGHTRENLTLTDEGKTVLAGHAAGPRLKKAPTEVLDLLIDRVVADARPGDIVSLNGSLPDGQDAQTWAKFADRAHQKGARIVLDGQGEALVLALKVGIVFAAKPNEEEVLALPNVEETSDLFERGRQGIRSMLSLCVVDPIVSLGSHGAMHLHDGEIAVSSCAVDQPKIVVGAGDAFIAGYCAALLEEGFFGKSSDIPPVHCALATAAAHVSGLDISNSYPEIMAFVQSVKTSYPK